MFELSYINLIKKILDTGIVKNTRNGNTKSIFGEQLKIDLDSSGIPLLQGRKIFYKGIFGEFAGFLRNCKSVECFEKLGCNYWKSWANEDGKLELDYSEQLFNFNGINQLETLIIGLKNNPHSRRHIINLWRPDRLDIINLPCCHYSYQFSVNNNKLDMVWVQRSGRCYGRITK